MDIKKLLLIGLYALSVGARSAAFSWPWSSSHPRESAHDLLKHAVAVQKEARNAWDRSYHANSAGIENLGRRVFVVPVVCLLASSFLAPQVNIPVLVTSLVSMAPTYYNVKAADARYRMNLEKALKDSDFQQKKSEYNTIIETLKFLQPDDVRRNKDKLRLERLQFRDEKFARAQEPKNLLGIKVHKWDIPCGNKTLRDVHSRVFGAKNTDAEAERIIDMSGLI